RRALMARLFSAAGGRALRAGWSVLAGKVGSPSEACEIPSMAWFRKEKKPRLPRRERLEIPPDVWEKCEACGHTDIREKFWRNLNVCPNCEYHRRIRANDYANLLIDEGTMEELEVELRSTD